MFLSRPISLLNLVVSISSAIDLMDPHIADHHTIVAYIASQLANELGLPQQTKYNIVLAGLLHDIGMLSLPDTERRRENDVDAVHHRHTEIGYHLLRKFRHFSTVARIVKDHHTDWSVAHKSGQTFTPEAGILRLADQVDALIDKDTPILEQVDHIVATIAGRTGSAFSVDHVDAFTELAWKEHFWLDIASPSLQVVLLNNCSNYSLELNGDDLIDFAEMLAQVIDFRCRFTATHSSGVATVASVLANLIGFSATECQKIQVAGYLHDIGKLALPQNLLEKPSKLNSTEYRIVKSHAYYTYRILEPLVGLDDVRMWASMHHERVDGYGYPGRLKEHDLPMGARIMAIADIFTALMEQRPYRGPMEKSQTIEILHVLAKRKAIDHNMTDVLIKNFDDINMYREHAQAAAKDEYELFLRSIADGSKQADDAAGYTTAQPASADL